MNITQRVFLSKYGIFTITIAIKHFIGILKAFFCLHSFDLQRVAVKIIKTKI